MRRRLAAALVAGALLAALAGGSEATVPNGNLLPALPASVTPISASSALKSYPVYDQKAKRSGSRQWRTSKVGGNCCETRLAATSRGRLLEFGGTDLLISEDEGESWAKVKPLTPLVHGEGDVVAAPNGDIVAVGWDVYSGDHLQSYKYTAATKKWEVGEVLIRSPAFDRPWLTLVPGPLDTPLGKVPYGVVLEGGIATFGKVVFFSSDGLHYDELQIPVVDDALADPVRTPLTATRNPDADYWAPAGHAGSTTLAGKGGTFIRVDNGACPVMRIIPPSTRLVCDAEAPHRSTLRQDSSGALIRAWTLDDSSVVVEVSRDAGRTWRAVRVRPPVDGTFDRYNDNNPKGFFHDLAVNGRLGFAALLTRVARPTEDGQRLAQDVVFVIDTTGRFPVVRESLFVGKGGVAATGGLAVQGGGPRLDFNTVTILPSGRIATGFMDSDTVGDPNIAIEQNVRRGRGGVIR